MRGIAAQGYGAVVRSSSTSTSTRTARCTTMRDAVDTAKSKLPHDAEEPSSTKPTSRTIRSSRSSCRATCRSARCCTPPSGWSAIIDSLPGVLERRPVGPARRAARGRHRSGAARQLRRVERRSVPPRRRNNQLIPAGIARHRARALRGQGAGPVRNRRRRAAPAGQGQRRRRRHARRHRRSATAHSTTPTPSRATTASPRSASKSRSAPAPTSSTRSSACAKPSSRAKPEHARRHHASTIRATRPIGSTRS